MHCTKCGNSVAGHVKFCSSCGVELRINDPKSTQVPTRLSPRSSMAYTVWAIIIGGLGLTWAISSFETSAKGSMLVVFIFGSWLAIAGYGFKQNWSVLMSYGIGFVAPIVLMTLGSSVFTPSDASSSNSISSNSISSNSDENVSVNDTSTESTDLLATAIICREADQVVEFLAALESNRMPDLDNCAINPTKTAIPIIVLEERMVRGESLVRWKKSTTEFTGWTLRSNISGTIVASNARVSNISPTSNTSLTIVERLENSPNANCNSLANAFSQANYITDGMMDKARKYGCL